MQSFKGAPSGAVVCYAVTVSVDPPSLATITGAFLNVAMPTGTCTTGQRVILNPLADISDAGYILAMPRVSATDTVRVSCVNSTGGTVNPGALNVSFIFLGKRGAA